MPDQSYARLFDAARQRPPRAALVLGSGLAGAARALDEISSIPFAQAPGLSSPSVPGHEGRLLLGLWAGQPVLVFLGRLHRYEGHPWRRVVQPVHVARELGAPLWIVTNAAGGIRDDLVPGAIMLLRQHIDATQPHWWSALGHRLPAAGSAALEGRAPLAEGGEPRPSPYSAALFARLYFAARACALEPAAGVYAQVSGPAYETKAEIRALRACGVDAVGMSTVREIDAAAGLGLQCAALSCITNRAAGLSDGPISHDEVLRHGRDFEDRLGRLLSAFFAGLDKPLTRLHEKA